LLGARSDPLSEEYEFGVVSDQTRSVSDMCHDDRSSVQEHDEFRLNLHKDFSQTAGHLFGGVFLFEIETMRE
jgi:hypothetical protein